MVTVDITEPKCPEDLRKPCKHTTSFPHPGFLMKTSQKESYSRSSCLCCQLTCSPRRNTRSTPAGSPHAQALPLTQAAAPMAPASFQPQLPAPRPRAGCSSWCSSHTGLQEPPSPGPAWCWGCSHREVAGDGCHIPPSSPETGMGTATNTSVCWGEHLLLHVFSV